jgi:hypothetical protein
VLKPIEDKEQKLRFADKSVLQLNITPLHDAHCVFEDEAFLVSFKNRKGNTVTNFNLFPASKAELIQLALFLGTCTYFHTTVTHKIVPGQQITSVPTIDGNVEVTLSTDSDLVALLADPSIVQSLTLKLNIDQLEAYEEFITSSISINKAIHSFNFDALETSKQLQLAS